MINETSTEFKSNQDGDATPKRNARLEQMRARLKPSLFNSEPNSAQIIERGLPDDEIKIKPALPISDCSSPNIHFTDDKKKNFESIRSNFRTQFSSTIGIASAFNLNNEPEKKNKRESSIEANDNSENSTKSASVNQSLKNERQITDDNDERNSEKSQDKKSLDDLADCNKPNNEVIEDVTPSAHTIFQKFMPSEEEKFGSPDEHVHYITNQFKDYFEEQEVLGEGASGTVKQCVKLSNKQEYAVKIVNYRGDEELKVLIITEFRNHRRLKNKNIVQVIELYVDESRNKIYTILELVKGKEMFEVIHDIGSYSEIVASKTFKQILLAIQYMHLNGVCHRDLKPNNILVSEDGSVVKIADFNVSKFSEEDKKSLYTGLSNDNYKMWTYTGTIAFTAPEVFTDTEYTEAVDMWSAGVVLYTMLCGYQPFQAEYLNDLIELIKKGEVTFQESAWEKVSAEAKDLVSYLLKKNYKERYSPSQALAHPWIQNIRRLPDRRMHATIRNLKTNLRRNVRGGFSIEPLSGLMKKREKINSMSDENKKWEILTHARQRGATLALINQDEHIHRCFSLINMANLSEKANEEDDEEIIKRS